MPERADNSPRWIAKRAAKAAVAGALCAAGARWLVRAVRRREAGGARVLILSYHRVTEDFARDAAVSIPSLLVSEVTLRRQLAQLGRERELVSLGDAARILAEPPPPPGTRRRPRHDVVAITFDDGYADNHARALPLLAELKIPATIFVASGFLGTERRLLHDRLHASLSELRRQHLPARRAGLPPPLQELLDACAEPGPAATIDRLIARLTHDHLHALAAALDARLGLREEELPAASRLMTWEQAREIAASGIAIGGHTVNHAVLANLTLARAQAEVEGCRDQIAEHVGTPPRHFAYPNGYYTPAVRRLVAECGFEAAVTTEDRENQRGGDPYTLRRKVLWENSSLGALGYSAFVAACNLDGVFGALGWARAVPGERPDPLSRPEGRAPPAREEERAAV